MGDQSKVWVVYHGDWSSLAIFDIDDELGALRYAVENHMEVDLVPTGVAVSEYIETTLRRKAMETQQARDARKEQADDVPF